MMFQNDPIWKRVLGYLFLLPIPLAVMAAALAGMTDLTYLAAAMVVIKTLVVMVICSGLVVMGISLLNS